MRGNWNRFVNDYAVKGGHVSNDYLKLVINPSF